MYDLETFYGPNAGYVLDLYERYKQDPASIDAATRAIFDSWSPDGYAQPAQSQLSIQSVREPTQVQARSLSDGQIQEQVDRYWANVHETTGAAR